MCGFPLFAVLLLVVATSSSLSSAELGATTPTTLDSNVARWKVDFEKVMAKIPTASGLPSGGQYRNSLPWSPQTTRAALERLYRKSPKDHKEALGRLWGFSQMKQGKCSPKYLEAVFQPAIKLHTSSLHIHKYLVHFYQEQLKFCGSLIAKEMHNAKVSHEDELNLNELYKSLPMLVQGSAVHDYPDLVLESLTSASVIYMKSKVQGFPDFASDYNKLVLSLCERVTSSLAKPLAKFQQLENFAYILLGLQEEDSEFIYAARMCDILVKNKQFVIEKAHETFTNWSVNNENHPQLSL